jgi:hypothetical protein
MPRKNKPRKLKSAASAVAPPMERIFGEPPLLCTRRHAAHLLGVSVATLMRMEQAGTLRPIKLTGAAAAMVHYRRDDLLLLARG